MSHLAAILDDFDLTLGCPVLDLLSLGAAASDVLSAMADYLIDNAAGRHLDQIVPSLSRNSEISLPLQALSARPANGLRRKGVCTWHQLGRLAPADLLELPALGRKSVIEVIELALHGAAMQTVLGPDRAEVALSFPNFNATDITHAENANSLSVSYEVEGTTQRILTDSSLRDLQTLARWAICIGDVTTVGGALELAATSMLPDDIAETIDALGNVSLDPLADEGADVANSYEFLLAQCGDRRQQEIFRRRIELNAPTLEQLGEEMSITRERVRQLQKTAEERVSAAVREREGSEIRWRAAQLRQQLGTAIAYAGAAAQAALSAATRAIPGDSGPAEALLLWLAGKYRLDKQTGWLFLDADYVRGKVGPLGDFGPPARAALLRQVAGDEGVVDIAALRSRAAAAGLVAPAADDWIGLCPFRDFDGTLILWQGSVADKAEALLGILKRPVTADELNELIGERHSLRSLRNRLLDDDRFVRTDRSRMGLRRWGIEEYTSIVDEIEEEIGRCGGEAGVNDLVRTLTKQFDLRSSSVASYTTVPRFVVVNGRIHVRRADEPFVPTRTLFDEAHAFLLDEHRCSYRVRVDGDVLRGSGRPLPHGVGAWLGVLPGTRREFRLRNNEILLVSWPESALLGPALGSLRRQALARSAEAGDSLLLEFDRSSDEVEAMLVRQSELEVATGWMLGTLLTGIDAGNQAEFEQLLAAAVGSSSAAETRRRCRDRGDAELVELVRMKNSPELDDALERLREVL